MADVPLHLLFDRRSYPEAVARCAAWRQAFSLSVDTVFAADQIEGFEASARFRSLGSVLLTDTSYTAHTVARDRRTVARTGGEQVILDVFVDGGFGGRVGGHLSTVKPGDCFVMDMRGIFRLRLKQGRFIGLIMPRPLFDDALGADASLHGLVLPASSPAAQMLGALLCAAANRMHDLSPELADALGPALLGIVCVCLRHAVGASRSVTARHDANRTRQCSVKPTMARLSRHIHRHATDPGYDADALARANGLSRSALYKLFQPSGGIAVAIRRRRAALALRLLMDGEGLNLPDVAKSSGFSNERALRRALWAEYDATPSALRRAGQARDRDGPDLAIGALFDNLPR